MNKCVSAVSRIFLELSYQGGTCSCRFFSKVEAKYAKKI